MGCAKCFLPKPASPLQFLSQSVSSASTPLPEIQSLESLSIPPSSSFLSISRRPPRLSALLLRYLSSPAFSGHTATHPEPQHLSSPGLNNSFLVLPPAPCLCLHPSIFPSAHPSISPLIYPPSTRSPNHPPFYPSTYPSIHPSTH